MPRLYLSTHPEAAHGAPRQAAVHDFFLRLAALCHMAHGNEN
jgi:hypothetical protein